MARRGHNEGTVYRRKDGRWAATIDLGYQEGRRARKTFYSATRAEVAQKLADALRDRHHGLTVARDERKTVAAFLEYWLAEAVEPKNRPRTVQGYQVIVRRHLTPAIGRVPIARLTPAQVQAFLNGMTRKGLSPQTVRHAHACLRRALNHAERMGEIQRNPARLVDLPAAHRFEAPTIAPEQARAILAAVAGDRLEGLVTVALATGLRQGEALGLQWSDIDLDGGTLTVRQTLVRIRQEVRFDPPKTSRSRRTVALAPTAVAALRAHRKRQAGERLWAGSRWQEGGLVFASTVGTPMSGGDVTKRFQALLEAAGLPRLRFHDLRHGAATLLLAQGVHPRVVMEQLGHSTITLTMDTYSHVIPAAARDAAERMEALLGGTG